ncbi:hypothetical protein HUT15_36820 (plasmid) [Streptomyces sp. NA03103]|uniref:hypothetical protein n=1 Tax=Streptomyces sp. NA03103 TaxID=2742134 RepID=UPI00159126DE|nr:hypothetical protein [Streptomyces sp. NA03103]QKW66091.1 hypothetical protein HUT15_36820 [Streptomyces sp. NA03103]
MQTAVLDNADSEDPVELPTDAVDLKLFRQAHGDRTFWCGVWLGGCGGRLTTRLCTDKICHFAHVPDPDAPDSPCRRTSSRTSGSGSADHLYVKAAVADWMARHGLSGDTRILRDPAGEVRLGAQITAEPSGHKPLRFILDASALLVPGETDASTVFGPDIEPDPRLLRRQGYVHRVRCVSEGAHRKVQFGTQSSDGAVDWYDFTADNVQMAPEGLSTRAAVEIRRRRSHTVPIGARTHDSAAKSPSTITPAKAVPVTLEDRSDLVKALREALAGHASVTPLQRCLDRLEAATRQGATAQENELIRQASDVLLRLRRGVGAPAPARPQRKKPNRQLPSSTTAAASSESARPANSGPRQEQQARRAAVRQARNILHRLTQPVPLSDPEMQQMQRDLTTALHTAGDKLLPSERRKAQAWVGHPTQPEPARTSFEHRAPAPDHVRSAVTAVRGALRKAAREQTTISWNRLQRQLGSALPRMTVAERVTLLTLVDQPTAKDEPLLSSLVVAGDPAMAASYREVAAALGLEVPADDDELRDVLEADVQQVHHHWRHR